MPWLRRLRDALRRPPLGRPIGSPVPVALPVLAAPPATPPAPGPVTSARTPALPTSLQHRAQRLKPLARPPRVIPRHASGPPRKPRDRSARAVRGLRHSGWPCLSSARPRAIPSRKVTDGAIEGVFGRAGTGYGLRRSSIAYTRKRASGPFRHSQAASGGESVACFARTGSCRANRWKRPGRAT
jgi:hypothetical protein